jgi:GntR family transcriptional regulator, trigonelline degradation regulator
MSDMGSALKVDRSAKTLRELALEKMREAIMGMHFRPGERLVERSLCDQLGVSRSIVREVLRHLEAEGLVENVPHRGPAVARPTPQQAAEIYEIRGVLEAIAARACAQAGSEEAIERLDQALRRIELAYSKKQPARVLAATNEFYNTLYEGGGKSIAGTSVSSLNARINFLRAMTIATHDRSTMGPQEMRRIVDAIRARDGEAAYRASLAHVESAASIALAILSSSEPAAEDGKPSL